ncbi:hypothetical protein FDECE_8793 [Fusarium decemcellulare]|nr:hypothetical protein FDECE_8793 [Fusarium decemcellulare]
MAPPALPLHRHQSSLEGIIDFSSREPLSAAGRASAIRRFYQVINHFDSNEVKRGQHQYDRVKLVRFTYEYSANQVSKDNVLIAVFEFLKLSASSGDDISFLDSAYRDELKTRLYEFADYLIDNFFLPPSTRKTPQPTPASHSAVMKTQRQGHVFAGTPERLASLRGACLIRDRYRCIISRKFDRAEALKRFQQQRDGIRAVDQDGVPLDEPGQRFDYLEVAHILPHSLTQLGSSQELSLSKVAALAILNMFDTGVAYLIEGVDIDRPSNALSLTLSHHMSFGDFRVYFEPIEGQPHRYYINTFLPPGLAEDVPVTRTLYITEDKTIDPPSPRLLAVHRAIAYILHLSAAGDYIDELLRDIEEYGIRSDGSTDLPRLVKLGLCGWEVGSVHF